MPMVLVDEVDVVVGVILCDVAVLVVLEVALLDGVGTVTLGSTNGQVGCAAKTLARLNASSSRFETNILLLRLSSRTSKMKMLAAVDDICKPFIF